MKKYSFEQDGDELFLVIRDGDDIHHRALVADKDAGKEVLDNYALHGVEIEEG